MTERFLLLLVAAVLSMNIPCPVMLSLNWLSSRELGYSRSRIAECGILGEMDRRGVKMRQ